MFLFNDRRDSLSFYMDAMNHVSHLKRHSCPTVMRRSTVVVVNWLSAEQFANADIINFCSSLYILSEPCERVDISLRVLRKSPMVEPFIISYQHL